MKQLIIILLIFPALSWGQANLGDANCDGKINVGDAVFLINYIFKGGPTPNCPTELPILTTTDVTSVTATTAQCGGTIISDGRATVIARGVCWSTSLVPTVADGKTTDGAGAGSFASSIRGLSGGTSYYVRAYATNSAGTGYGMTMSFMTNPSIVPEMTTADISEITQTTAKCGGTITSDGGAPIIARGVCWSTNQTPTIADGKTTDGAGTGSYTSYLTDLTADMTFYVRAYAINSVGIGYGDVMTFRTIHETGTATDIDGNTYQTVKIGSQWWMAENLKVIHYRNGEVIPNVTDSATWGGLTTGAYCDYNNDVSNVVDYGRLYNWFAANDSRNIAPIGWHVPSDAEWQTLVDYLGGAAVAGGKLKETGTTHWSSPNTGATNESEFSALPGGFRFDNGMYYNVNNYATIWSSTENGNSGAWSRTLGLAYSGVYHDGYDKAFGFSVRCIRD